MTRPIHFLSAPIQFNMDNAWFEIATADNFWFSWRLEVIQKLLADRLVTSPAVEVGCGNCLTRNQLEKAFQLPITGVDVNLPALESAREGLGDLVFYNVHDKVAAWRDYFKTLFLLDTLEHIEKPVEFLRTLAYHLATDGLLILNVPAISWLYSDYDRVVGHQKRYSPRLIEQELSAGGFLLEKFNFWGFSLLPLGFIRRMLPRFRSSRDLLKWGFQPQFALQVAILRLLSKCERKCRQVPLGTSIVAIARKVAQ